MKLETAKLVPAASPRNASAVLLFIATAALAVGTFVADTVDPNDLSFPLLYIVVVLMAARLCRGRDLVLVAAGCLALLALSYLVSPPIGPSSEALLRLTIRGTVIGLTAYLVLQTQSAETGLREKAALLDLTQDTIFVRDMDDVITYWNRGAAELYGWAVEEAVGKAAHDLLTTRFPAPLDAIRAELHAVGIWEGELVHTKRDGAQVTVFSRWALQRDGQGRPFAILETNNDITERKRAEYLTRQVFENSPNGIFIIDRDYRYRRVNPVYLRRMGIPAEQIAGKHVSDLFGTELFERTLKPNLDRCFAGEEFTYTDWFDFPFGRFYLAKTYSPLRAGTERVDSALVITHDLTGHMQATEALQAAQGELAQVARMNTLGELAASIAHEINQPLTAVVNGANAGLRWLDGESPELDEARQMLARIRKDGNRAAEVIARIRALASKSPIRMDRLAINDVVEDVISLVRNEIDRNRVVLRARLADDLPPILGDRVHLQQVILNLVVNAIEAMHDNEPRELLITSSKDEAENVLVSVRDSGPGLDPQSVNRIFQSFFTTKPSGMGMGLSICQSIVEAHGGQLSARPNEPRGALFEVALPREQAQGRQPAKRAKRS